MDSVKRDYREGFDLHPSFQEGGHLFHPRCTHPTCGGAALPRDVFGVCSSHPEHVPGTVDPRTPGISISMLIEIGLAE